uniref:Uncharacterized protein n=1 Tax=Caenorhabditis japonica TaxID=281687 RepID=A0A8R1EG86_CAEJA
MCNPTKQIKFDPREDPRKQKELEDEMKEWLPTVGNHIIEAKHTFEEYYPPLKSIIRNKEKIVWGSQYKHLDVGSLRSMMEHELTELGVTRLQKMVCNSCACYFPATVLYLVKHKNGSVASCQSCWKSADTRPSKTLFQLLIVRISDKWATLVGLRVDYLYGKWNERLAPMVKNLKENVLRAGEIASLLKTSTDPEEFIEACEMVDYCYHDGLLSRVFGLSSQL